VLLLAGALTALAAVNAWWQARTEATRVSDAISAFQQQPVPTRAASRRDTAARTSHDHIAAQLNARWQPAFDAINAARSDKIALLAFDAHQTKRQLKLVAEARRLADAVAFVEALQQQPDTVRAALTQHEIREDSNEKPVRFHITLEWRA
jgi:hypothetical protein